MIENQPAKLPGEVVREALEEAGWSQSDLAYVLGVTTATVNQIVNGKRSISYSMAKALGRALNMPPETLVKVQAEWDLSQASEPDPIVTARARILSGYPLREMVKRGWIAESRESEVLERRVCRFFDVQAINDVPHLAHAARRVGSDIPAPQLAWLFRVRQIAREMVVPPFNNANLVRAIEELSNARRHAEGVRHVPRLMYEAGIRFVVVENLPGGRIDGVCLWLDAKSPVIGMSLRFDRIDNFWFVLRHECAHVLHGHGRNSAIIDADLDQYMGNSMREEEQIANREGAEFCVPQAQMKSFYQRKNPLFAERDVLAFAKKVGVHPGLVVGQLQRMTDRYDLLRRHLVKVRNTLGLTMLMDGWGDIVPAGQ